VKQARISLVSMSISITPRREFKNIFPRSEASRALGSLEHPDRRE
jgi:hypothetical protein